MDNLTKIAKLYWQDEMRKVPDAKELCLKRLSHFYPENNLTHWKDKLIRGDWYYKVNTQVYGCLWIVNGECFNFMLNPHHHAYRLSLTNGKWAYVENNLERPMRFGSEKDPANTITFKDLELVEPTQVPDEVYKVAMIARIT